MCKKCLIPFISADYDMVTTWQELEVVERTFWTFSLNTWVQGQESHLLISLLGLGVFSRSFLVSKGALLPDTISVRCR